VSSGRSAPAAAVRSRPVRTVITALPGANPRRAGHFVISQLPLPVDSHRLSSARQRPGARLDQPSPALRATTSSRSDQCDLLPHAARYPQPQRRPRRIPAVA
jgi:hypothetical protein